MHSGCPPLPFLLIAIVFAISGNGGRDEMLQCVSPIDRNKLRQVLGCFLTGVTVVTALDEQGRPRGLTANSFTSVSLDPPLVLVCIGSHAASFSTFATTTRFAINVLTAHQQETSDIFASRRADKFDAVEWHLGPNGAPLLDHALVRLECDLHERMECADHIILIGSVRGCQALDGAPLAFFRGKYIAVEAGQPAANRRTAG